MLPRHVRIWEILITPDVVSSRGWSVRPTPTAPLDAEGRGRLEGIAREAASIVQLERDAPIHVLRDRLLDTMEQVFDGLLVHEPTDPFATDRRAGHELVEAAAAVLRSTEMLGEVRIPDLARTLGVSERSIYAAFRANVGMGPYEFTRLQRLHTLRRALTAGPGYHGKIAASAGRVGFADPKRATKVYGRHFGESPRDTIRRRTSLSSALR